ncbi:MAG: glycosyltransferase family 25 protein [Pseudolabrys sp.]
MTQWTDLGLGVLAVSLVRSSDRRERFASRMRSAGIDFNFVDAIDGDDGAALRHACVCDPQREPSLYDHRAAPISGREIACTLSHMKAVREAHARGFERTLICEDDLDISGVTAVEIAKILDHLPDDAGYLQLCITPERSMRRLAEYYVNTGQLFARKSANSAILLEHPYFNGFTFHCTTAYVVTAAGAALQRRYFEDGKVVFPCKLETIGTNAGLLADRFVYRAYTDGDIKGYVCCIPTVTYECLDSLIHPDHLESHLSAKLTALKIRSGIVTRPPMNRVQASVGRGGRDSEPILT